MRRPSNPAWPRRLFLAAAATLVWANYPLLAAAQTELPPLQGVEVLARGPIHEAFLSPPIDSFQPTNVVASEPPAPIDEIPPEFQPTGSIWLPGYWFWSAADNEFVWVSGVWRVPPPSQRWVPGYWENAAGGVRWISGFWAADQMAHVQYLPAPPEEMERGPTTAAPGTDYFWLPGHWVYQNNNYVWQPGFWTRSYDNWLWVPAHYRWTPRGAVFVNGYWDYPVDDRGTVFCPVRFHNRVYAQPGFRFAPSAVVVTRHLLLHLFAGPRWNHYFYGNYYGDVAVQAGLQPWFQYRQPYRHPLLTYYTWHFSRQNVAYADRLQNWYAFNERYPDRRPPVSFAEQQQLAARANADGTFAVLVRPFTEAVSSRTFLRLDPEQRVALGRYSSDLRALAQHRASVEVRAAATAAADSQPVLDLPRFDRSLLSQLRRPDGQTQRVFRPDFDRAIDGRSAMHLPGGAPSAELPAPSSVTAPGGDPDRHTPDLRRPEVNVPGQGQTPRGDRPGISLPGRVETPRGMGPGSNVPANRSPGPGRSLDDRTGPDLNQPDLRRPDINLPGRGQTPQGARPGISVPGRVETPRGSGPGGISTPTMDSRELGPTRDLPSGRDLNQPDLRRPDVTVPGQGQTPPGVRPGISVPGRVENPRAYSPDANLDVPEVPENSPVPGRNDLQPFDRPEVNLPGRMEPPRGYVPGPDAPGLPRPNLYRPGMSTVPGDGEPVAPAPMPRVDQPGGTRLPRVTPEGQTPMPQLTPRPNAAPLESRPQGRSTFGGVNPENSPPRVSPAETTPRINPGSNVNPQRTPIPAPERAVPNPRSDNRDATRLPGGNSLPGGINPNPGSINPNPGGMIRPGGNSPAGGTPRAGNPGSAPVPRSTPVPGSSPSSGGNAPSGSAS